MSGSTWSIALVAVSSCGANESIASATCGTSAPRSMPSTRACASSTTPLAVVIFAERSVIAATSTLPSTGLRMSSEVPASGVTILPETSSAISVAARTAERLGPRKGTISITRHTGSSVSSRASPVRVAIWPAVDSAPAVSNPVSWSATCETSGMAEVSLARTVIALS